MRLQEKSEVQLSLPFALLEKLDDQFDIIATICTTMIETIERHENRINELNSKFKNILVH